MKMLMSLLPVVAFSLPVQAEDVGPYLQSISVNVKAGTGYDGKQGSGTVFLVQRKERQPIAFVVTAAHVVKGLRDVKSVIGKDGEDKKSVRYRDAQVVHEKHNEEGTRVVGDDRLDAKILNVDAVRDIALLQVRAVGEYKATARFYRGSAVPVVGTAILHCGCPGGQDISGTGAVTAGIISRIGVRIPEFGGSEHGVYDHVDCAAMGGSSGGMICRASDGEFLGMITLGLQSGDNFHWLVPARSIRSWAKEIGAEWLLDPDATVTDAEIAVIPLENEAGGEATPTPAKKKATAFSTMEMPGEQEFSHAQRE